MQVGLSSRLTEHQAQAGPSPSPSPGRSHIYAAHLQQTLLPDLEAAQRQLVQVDSDITEYETLQTKLVELDGLQDRKGIAIESLTEFGAGLWVESRISDPTRLTLDLGLDIHLDLSISEAQAYIEKKVDVLKKKRDVLRRRVEGLVWQIEQFEGALVPHAPEPETEGKTA